MDAVARREVSRATATLRLAIFLRLNAPILRRIMFGGVNVIIFFIEMKLIKYHEKGYDIIFEL